MEWPSPRGMKRVRVRIRELMIARLNQTGHYVRQRLGRLGSIRCLAPYGIPVQRMPDVERSSVSRVLENARFERGVLETGPVTGTAPVVYQW